MATRAARPTEGGHEVDEGRLRGRIAQILNRHAAVGLALGVVRGRRLVFFHGHGLADLASGTPISEDTAFRIGSVTKLFTAVAIMQLYERGLVDLDAPASGYLRAFRLLRAHRIHRRVTLRHLLTHTSGIPDVRHPLDLLHFGWGPFEGRPPLHSVPVGEPMPSLAEYYRGGLASVVEPGTAFAYSNHGFAALGQIVEDVGRLPLDRYLREHVFEPLGMDHTELRRSARIASRLATGYTTRRSGPEPVPDRDWIGAGGGGIYSTTADIARFVAAILDGGGGAGGFVLRPATLASMLHPQWQTDERLTAMGLAFFLSTVGRHRLAGHDGILPGFNSHVLMAPDDDLGVVAFTNGASGAMSWLPAEVTGLALDQLGVPEPHVRKDVAHHPEIWPDLCGRYRLPARISDMRGRLLMGRGAEVYVQGGHLRVRIRAPIPGLRHGFALHPDDENDPHVFRIDPSGTGAPTFRIVFARDRRRDVVAAHTDLGGQPISLIRSPIRRSRRTRAIGPPRLVRP
jgi:CubicO group peptidase (beta-lactamase class C family)